MDESTTTNSNSYEFYIARGEKDILAKAKEIRANKTKQKRLERLSKIENKALVAPTPLDQLGRRYTLIYMDPPWRYDNCPTEERAIENQYPTMSNEELRALPVQSIAADDCIMFMWTTSTHLPFALELLSIYGFEYKTQAVWNKEVIGQGFYFRQQYEILLIGMRGSIPTPLPANRVSSVISARRSSIHSQKPEIVYEIIEKMYPELSKIELFGRNTREGWTYWGNQIVSSEG